MTLDMAAEMDALNSKVPSGTLIRLRDMQTGFIGTNRYADIEYVSIEKPSGLGVARIRKNGRCLIREEVPFIYLGCSADNDYMFVYMLFWKGVTAPGANFQVDVAPRIVTIPFRWDDLARKAIRLDWLIEVIRIPD